MTFSVEWQPVKLHKVIASTSTTLADFERDAFAQLAAAGLDKPTADAYVSRAYAMFAAGVADTLDAALAAAVKAHKATAADAEALDVHRAAADVVLAEQEEEDEESDVNDPAAAADPTKQIAALTATVRAADPTMSLAKARTRVLKAHPDLYGAATSTNAPTLSGEPSLADLVNEAFAVELKKRIAKGVAVAVASHDIAKGRPELAELAELARLHPTEAALPIDVAAARLSKHRPDVARLIKSAKVIDGDAITAIAKRQRR